MIVKIKNPFFFSKENQIIIMHIKSISIFYSTSNLFLLQFLFLFSIIVHDVK